jgi:Fe-Mn family superoxide dismutase
MPHRDLQLTRRATLQLLGASAGIPLVLQGGFVMATEEDEVGSAVAYRGEHQPKPLPFDPAKLKGLSEKLLRSHHENNYTGAVKRLNLIERQLGSMPADAQPYQMGSLKREELIAMNSMRLHEAYFGNLGGGAGSPDGTFARAIKTAYGSLEAWERDFRLTGLSLGGGSGWVVTSWDPRTQQLHNWWAFDHTHGLAGGTPVFVMDMYEHSYHLDYGANAKGYIDAFFQNVKWDEVNRRLEAMH